MASKHEDLLELIDGLYAAAVDPALWPAALARMQTLLRASAAAVELHDARTKDVLMIQSNGLPEDGLRRYQEYFHLVCPRLRGAKLGEIDYDYKFFSEAEMDRDEFYADFLAPDGFRYYAYTTVIDDADVWAAVGVHRSPRQGHVDEREVALLAKLGPHVRRALQLHLRLAGLEARARSFEDGLDRLRRGVVLLDREGRITFMNRAARALLARRRGALAVVGKRLSGRRAADRARLDRLSAAVLGQRAGPPGGGMAVVHDDDGAPVSVLAVPLPAKRAALEHLDEGVRAIVFLSDAAAGLDAKDELLRAAFGLTSAEARVALSLLAGATLADHAERAGIRFTTARSHYAHLRAKLGARSEADVIRRLVALVPDVI